MLIGIYRTVRVKLPVYACRYLNDRGEKASIFGYNAV
jgi:hypothetical protein